MQWAGTHTAAPNVNRATQQAQVAGSKATSAAGTDVGKSTSANTAAAYCHSSERVGTSADASSHTQQMTRIVLNTPFGDVCLSDGPKLTDTAGKVKMGVINEQCIAAARVEDAVVEVKAVDAAQQRVTCSEATLVGLTLGKSAAVRAIAAYCNSSLRVKTHAARRRGEIFFVGETGAGKTAATIAVAAAARQEEAEARNNASVVSTREETKVDVVNIRKQPVYRTERRWVGEVTDCVGTPLGIKQDAVRDESKVSVSAMAEGWSHMGRAGVRLCIA